MKKTGADNKITKKKGVKRSVFFKTLIALAVLSSVLVSTLLGVSKAEYFKTFSKKLDLEGKPDLMLQYALWDANGTGNEADKKAFQWEEGVYKNAESFHQDIVVGRNDTLETGIYDKALWNNALKAGDYIEEKYPEISTDSSKNKISWSADNFKYNGTQIVYQIKLPVDEPGYYLLNFQIDFRLKTTKTPDPWASDMSGFYTQSYDRAIGCEILNHDDGFTFKNTTPLDLYSRSKNDSVYYKSEKTENDLSKQNVREFFADSAYQWKTLAPSRAENVSLAFKVEQKDVDNGYVLWMWDLDGLYGARTWRMEFSGVSVEKTMELDGSTKTRDSKVDPYFMFPQTSFMNNQYMLALTDPSDPKAYDHPYNIGRETVDNSVRSVEHNGKMTYSKGRGTFATAATSNSLTFQAESLFYGFDNSNRKSTTLKYETDKTFLKYQYLDEDDEPGYSNPVAVYIPLKNIQFDTDYKVTFDLSVARQGSYGVRTPSNCNSGNDGGVLGNIDALSRTQFYGLDDKRGSDGSSFGGSLVNYVNPLGTETGGNLQNQIFRKDSQLFSSYLFSGDATKNRTEVSHRADGMTQIKYADKTYEKYYDETSKYYFGYPLTKYDEINELDSFLHSVTQSVNNTYCNGYSENGANDKHKAESRNWFNAVLNTEYNGQNEIHWVTFYNTTFSFNIPKAENADLDLSQLKWVWAMDSLISGCYYRIKLENVRIEKVVKYTSSLDVNGVKIAGTQLDLKTHSVPSPVGTSKGYGEEDNINKGDASKPAVYNTFMSFRGINGTGQNYQAKGFVIDKGKKLGVKDTSQKFMADGNIYAPIIDATKFIVRPDDMDESPDANGARPPTEDAYKIELSGFAVCQGGVAKYVFSIDGGQTWEDMTFDGTKADTGQLDAAARGVNQWTSGQTRYYDEYVENGVTVKDFEQYAETTHQQYTHLDGGFTERDGINANFDDFNLVANLIDYKNQANLDIIIAAVPMEDQDYRCEILRIINFNQVRNYMTFPFDFVSDIKVNGSNGTESPLNVNRIDETAESHGNYWDNLVDPEAIGFSFLKTWCLVEDRNSDNEIIAVPGPLSTTGYSRNGSYTYAYEDVRTLYSDMPVKTSLGLTGWAIVEGGVEAYYWSADNGKTWTPCTRMDTATNTATAAAAPKTRNLVSPQYKKYYYDGLAFDNTKTEDNVLRNNHCFRDSVDGAFDGDSFNTVVNGEAGSGKMITANLSKYKGQVVDVIFAAKPTQSDVYVPVGRIDNVAVYGATGTFYTHINSVMLGGTVEYTKEFEYGKAVGGTLIEPDYFDIENKPLNHVTKSTDDKIIPQWNLGYSADGAKEFSYTIYEPNNVNAFNSRLYNNELNEIPSGGQVCIDGYTAVKASSNTMTYKYTLDGGETWSVIHRKNRENPCTEDEKNRAQYSDNSIDQTSGKNRYSLSVHDTCLVFNIPALPDGAIRDLLVVIEDNDGDVMPVLHIKLRIKGNNIGLFTYDQLNKCKTNFKCYDNMSSISFPFKTYKTYNDETVMKFTFPVEREGVHTLSFDVDLKLGNHTPTVSQKENFDVNQIWTEALAKTGEARKIQMSVEKTDFIEGEDINVSYYTDVVGTLDYEAGYDRGVFCDAVICIARLDNDGTEHLYKEVGGGSYPHYERAHFIAGPGSDEILKGNTEVRSGVVNLKTALTEAQIASAMGQTRNAVEGLSPDLPAGKYRIYFINDESIRFGNVVLGTLGNDGKSYGNMSLIDPIDITIHDAEDYVKSLSAAIVHDDVAEKGGERYYANKSNKSIITNLYTSEDSRVDKIARWTTNNAFDTNNVEFYFNATAEDVKRGYVILDWDIRALPKDVVYEINIKNLLYSYGVKSTKKLVTEPDGTASNIIRVPALEVGTHEFMFSSYASSYGPIVHNGLNQTVTYGNTNRGNGGNYLAAGAYMSVEKNVFAVGEPIHVSYNTAGAGTGSNPNPLNSPWIGITKANDEGRDVVIGRVFLEKNAVGSVAFNSGMNGCVEVIDELAHLPAGDYKLYFRDNSANIYGDTKSIDGKPDNLGEYWPQMNITDPIAIKIIDPNVLSENPYQLTYSFDEVRYVWTNHYDDYKNGVSGWISLDKTVFRVGEDITFNYHKSEAFGNADGTRTLYIGFAPPNYTGDSFINDIPNVTYGDFEDKKIDIPNDIAPGRYQLYCCDYGFADARKYGSVIAVIDITILPEIDPNNPSTVTLNYGHPDDNEETPTVFNPCASWVPAYEFKKEKVSINVTAEDVERGYVEFKYELNNLVPNTEVFYSTEMFYERFGYDPNFIYERQGDYLYFGLYPQTLKPENVNIFLKDGPNEQGYYQGSDGYLYAQVVADSSVSGYKFANDSQILSGITYYFRVEPLKWRIVGESDGDMTVICESIINAMEYGESNNYEESAVRDWLVDEFYNTAFNERQKALIKTVNVDNSACANTDDKIYLPSYSNVKRYSKAEVLSKTSTDFARVVGSYVDLLGKGNWMLRSPIDSSTLKVSGYDYSGRLYDTNVDDASNGVVPMLKLSYKFDDPNTQVGRVEYTVPPPGDRYGVTGGSSYGVSHDNVLTSNFEITKRTIQNRSSSYSGAYISVPKTYYEQGENIVISYKAPYKANAKYRIYITTDNMNKNNRYADCQVKEYTLSNGSEGKVNLSQMSTSLYGDYVRPNDTQYWETLPPGEYKIWLMDIYNHSNGNTYSGGTPYHQYTNDSGAITEAISIKILPKGELNPDFSITHYSDWEYFGTNYDDPVRLNWTSLTLDKNVFKQGEKIHYYIDGSWEHKWVGVFSADTYSMGSGKVEDYPGKDKTWRYAQWGHKDYINAGSNYLETETLTPGQYKVVYVFGLTLESAWAHDIASYNNHAGNSTTKTKQKIMTVIDITILPENCGNQIVTVNYTKADGTEGETSISHPIHFFTPISFDTVLDSVRPGSSITFTTSTSGTNRTIEKVIRTNVSAINYEDNSNAEVDVDDELYTYIDKEVGDSSTYRFNYSALKNVVQDSDVYTYVTDKPSYFQDSYMKVDKTYFNVGEPINVTYTYNNEDNGNVAAQKAWICIASMGKDESIKDSYIRYKVVEKGDVDKTFDITKAEGEAQNDYAKSLRNLPAGEYKIWFIFGPPNSERWWDYEQSGTGQNYNNPYINQRTVTDPICIKIVDSDDSDTSLEYKAWVGKDGDSHGKAKYAHIKLEKNVFMQGEPIKAAFYGRTQYMYVWLHNDENVELRNTHTLVTDLPGINNLEGEKGKYITEWSDFYSMDKMSNLAPGKYKLYYAVYSNTYLDSVYGAKGSGAIVAIIDITILPREIEETPTLKLYAIYTNTAGKQVRRPIDDDIVLNNLLNNNKENYNLTDNDNRVEGIVEFNDVMPNSKIRFYFTYKIGGNVSSDDNIKCTVEEVPCGTYDIKYSTSSNFTIEKPGFRYIATSGGTAPDTYKGSSLSLPGVYYEYGEPIMLSYKIKGTTPKTPRIIITTEILSKGSESNAVIPEKDLYVTIPIKYKGLTNLEGTIDVNDLINWSSLFMQGDSSVYREKLPVGVYKVWLVDDAFGSILGYKKTDGTIIGGDFAENPFKAAASLMITEPITIKVIDPENPNFSIMSNVYAPNKGLNKDADVEFNHNTRIGIDKAIFTQGEKIRFHIQLDYSFRHVMITQGTVSNVTATNEPTKGDWDEANRGITWQYAKYGVTDSGYDTLDTSGLAPGHYKIYYLMGKTLQEAIRGDRFDHPDDPSFKNDDYATYSKLYTIIDIIILPKDATQTLTVTYTKYDGTTATITEQFPMMGIPIGTELHKGKELTRYHMGVNFTKIINDAMPGTDFKFSTTSNLAEVWGDSWNTWKDRTYIDVLKQSAVRIN